MDLEESLHDVLEYSGERFADRFYRVLFERHPELKNFFQGVNLQHQAAMLTMAIQVMVQHYRSPKPATTDYLKVIGHRHHDRGIERNRYDDFGNALLATLAEFHGDGWTPELADGWRNAYLHAIDTLLQGYPSD